MDSIMWISKGWPAAYFVLLQIYFAVFASSDKVSCPAALFEVISTEGRTMEEDIISSYIVTSLVECGHKCLECKDCVTFSHRITQNYGINCKVSGPTSELIVKNQLGDDEIWTTYRIIEPEGCSTNHPCQTYNGRCIEESCEPDVYTYTSRQSRHVNIQCHSRCKNASALGMESGEIRDNHITASSEYDINHRAPNGRLNFMAHGGRTGAWSSRRNDRNQWLQVDFQRSTIITGISTQGREGCCDQFVKSYTISFGDDGIQFHSYKPKGILKVFGGNSDRNSMVNHIFTPLIVARFIRVQVTKWNVHISMRAEFYGCSY